VLSNSLWGNRCRWPAFSIPKDDELLSSWLVRLAMSHGLKLHTFCSIAWPRKQIWNRDIDKLADRELLDVLGERTGLTQEIIKGTTLAAYEGWVYEKHNPYGNTLWIMPVGVYHRTRTQFGLQFCPLCLAGDREPYFRRRWRLAFITVCGEHKIPMLDRCHNCGAAVNFHRNELGNRRTLVAPSITLCYSCGHELRDAAGIEPQPADEDEIVFQRTLTDTMNRGCVELCQGEAVYSHLYFTGLHQIMRVLATGKRAAALREVVGLECSVDNFSPSFHNKNRDIESLPVDERRMLLNMACYLLEEWPDRFVAVCKATRAWSATLLRDLEPAPFWYWSVIHEHLYRYSYRPSDKEIDSAVRHLRKSGQALNKKVLSRSLGVTAVHRKRKTWKPVWE